MSNYKSMVIRIETYERLQKAKISKGETIDYLLTRLLNKYEGLYGQFEKSQAN